MTAPDRRPTGRRSTDRRIYTAADLAHATGMAQRDIRRFFRALGFPDPGDEVSYSEADLTVLAPVPGVAQAPEVALAAAVRRAGGGGQTAAGRGDGRGGAMASRAEQLGGGERETRHKGAQYMATEVS